MTSTKGFAIERLSELLSYKELVDSLADNNEDFFFDNSNILHAQIVISKLLDRTDKEAFILTDNFNPEFYEALLEKLKNFLKQGKKLNVCILKKNKGNKILETLKREFPNRIEIYNCDNIEFPFESLKELLDKFPFLRKFIKHNQKINFIIDDIRGSRLEIKEEIKKLEHEAEIAEKQTDYNKVAEIRYGKIPEEQKKLKEVEEKIEKAKKE